MVGFFHLFLKTQDLFSQRFQDLVKFGPVLFSEFLCLFFKDLVGQVLECNPEFFFGCFDV